MWADPTINPVLFLFVPDFPSQFWKYSGTELFLAESGDGSQGFFGKFSHVTPGDDRRLDFPTKHTKEVTRESRE
jgi:hypothetical protein